MVCRRDSFNCRDLTPMEHTGIRDPTPTGGVSIRYQLCPSCGSFVHFTERMSYCIVCGTRLLNDCPQCHEHIIFPTGKFCPTCGTALVIGKE